MLDPICSPLFWVRWSTDRLLVLLWNMYVYTLASRAVDSGMESAGKSTEQVKDSMFGSGQLISIDARSSADEVWVAYRARSHLFLYSNLWHVCHSDELLQINTPGNSNLDNSRLATPAGYCQGHTDSVILSPSNIYHCSRKLLYQ